MLGALLGRAGLCVMGLCVPIHASRVCGSLLLLLFVQRGFIATFFCWITNCALLRLQAAAAACATSLPPSLWVWARRTWCRLASMPPAMALPAPGCQVSCPLLCTAFLGGTEG